MASENHFQQKVLREVAKIPCGTVSTYRRIACQLGRPQAARAVGNALAINPFPIVIPCHRVVKSDRSLGGYQGGPKKKKALLVKEGVKFDRLGKVLPRFIV